MLDAPAAATSLSATEHRMAPALATSARSVKEASGTQSMVEEVPKQIPTSRAFGDSVVIGLLCVVWLTSESGLLASGAACTTPE